jgi:hypothetical protein
MKRDGTKPVAASDSVAVATMVIWWRVGKQRRIDSCAWAPAGFFVRPACKPNRPDAQAPTTPDPDLRPQPDLGLGLPTRTPSPTSDFRLSGSPAGHPAGPPRIRTCRFPASGSSSVGFARRRAGGRCEALEAGNAPAADASPPSGESPSGYGGRATCARWIAPRERASRAHGSST